MKKSVIATIVFGVTAAAVGTALVLAGPRLLDAYQDIGKPAELRKALVDSTRDPNAAQLRNVSFRVARGGPLPNYSLCAEVNAKNAYGGYTGFKWAWVNQVGAEKPSVSIDSGDDGAESICASIARFD